MIPDHKLARWKILLAVGAILCCTVVLFPVGVLAIIYAASRMRDPNTSGVKVRL